MLSMFTRLNLLFIYQFYRKFLPSLGFLSAHDHTEISCTNFTPNFEVRELWLCFQWVHPTLATPIAQVYHTTLLWQLWSSSFTPHHEAFRRFRVDAIVACTQVWLAVKCLDETDGWRSNILLHFQTSLRHHGTLFLTVVLDAHLLQPQRAQLLRQGLRRLWW